MSGGIAGMGDTFDLPNYTGELFLNSSISTPLLRAIGGINGAEAVVNREFEWQEYDILAAAIPGALEGANAPAGHERVRGDINNVCQIFHKTIDVSYTKQAAIGLLAGVTGGTNPVTNEIDFQVSATLRHLALSIDNMFIMGTYQNPGDIGTPRLSRGIREAIDSHITDASGVCLNSCMVNEMMKDIFDDGGIDDLNMTILTNTTQKIRLTKAFVTDKNYQELTRNIGGVNVTYIVTDFGNLNIIVDRNVPQDEIIIVNLSVLTPKILYIPGKGFLFVEPLAKVGSADRYQIYGEIGLKYGLESMHGRITNLCTTSVCDD